MGALLLISLVQTFAQDHPSAQPADRVRLLEKRVQELRDRIFRGEPVAEEDLEKVVEEIHHAQKEIHDPDLEERLGKAFKLAFGLKLDLLWVGPFILLLLAIAVCPLFLTHWWERNANKALVSFLLALPVGIFLCTVEPHLLVHKGLEYASFIILIGSLFVISGGIHLRGSPAGTPLVNTAFLGIGAVLASLIGTTGASMLLIRPLLRANRKRKRVAHIVIFFIFLVANIGGSLTPLGDPPLFLGFLRGVPFEWCFQLTPMWLFSCAILLILFNLIDQVLFNREELEELGVALGEEVQPKEPISIEGKGNFLFLLGVIASALLSGLLHLPYGAQEAGMVAMAVLSLIATPPSSETRKENAFTFGPIIEVAVLFAGIFVTMGPCLILLEARGEQLLAWVGVRDPWVFFWSTGALSSFLDNAPTYLTFSALASGVVGTNADRLGELVNHPQGAGYLVAVACGAVFMGANTYIGNGPNFMVKAIAEENGVKMPSFFGYMVWSTCILLPIFAAVTFIFFL